MKQALFLLCFLTFLISKSLAFEYGRDGCCIRYGWITYTYNQSESSFRSYCTGDYVDPKNVEEIQSCLTIQDVSKLYFLHSNLSVFIKYDNFTYCNTTYCQQFVACVLEKCRQTDLVSTTSIPLLTTTTTALSLSTTLISTTPLQQTSTQFNNTFASTSVISTTTTCGLKENVYVLETDNSHINQKIISHSIDNKQSTIGLRMMIATTGYNPFTMNQTSTPFIGQIIVTVTDETQVLDGWIECDGRELNVDEYTDLYNVIQHTFGNSTHTGTFFIPNCTQRVLLGQSNEFVLGTYGGTETINLTENLILPAHSAPSFDVEFSNCDDYSNITISISNGAIDYQSMTHVFNNMQPYIVLNFLIVAKGVLPFKTRFGNELIVGEIIISSSNILPQGFVSCNGSYLVIKEYYELFQVFGFKYGGNYTMKKFKIPDCQERTFMMYDKKTSSLNQVGGEMETEINLKNIAAHSHQETTFVTEKGCSINIQTYEEDEDECNPISNMMPYFYLNIGYYNGRNKNANYSSHFLGALGLFLFEKLPAGFEVVTTNTISNSRIADYIGQDFVWDYNDIIFPDFRNVLITHSNPILGYGIINGNNYIKCNNLLLDHQHYIFIDTYSWGCNNTNNQSYENQIKNNNIWSTCMYTNVQCQQHQYNNSLSCDGYQFRELPQYISANYSKEVRHCSSNDNCLQLEIVGDKYSYEENSWKLMKPNSNITIAYGRDKGENCITVDESECYELIIYDKEGDGIDSTQGYIAWYYNNNILGFDNNLGNNNEWFKRKIDICIPPNPCYKVVFKGDKFMNMDNEWNIYDTNNQLITSNSFNVGDCNCINNLMSGHCYKLVVYDKSGDGICCKNGNGTIEVTRDDKSIFKYAPLDDESFTFKSISFCI